MHESKESRIALPPGVEPDVPESVAPPQVIDLVLTLPENGPPDLRAPGANGQYAEGICDLMLKRVRWMPLDKLTVGEPSPGKHVLAVRWDKGNPDPVEAFTACVSSPAMATMGPVEQEAFVDWLCKRAERGIEQHNAAVGMRNAVQGIQAATAGQMQGLRVNGRR